MGSQSPSRKHYRGYLFGPFRVLCDAVPLGTGAPRLTSARTLLKWFLLHPGQRFSTTELSTVLWPRQDPVASRSRLNGTIHHLRRFLDSDSEASHRSSFVRSVSGGYEFAPGDQWHVDLWDAVALIGQAEAARDRGDYETAIRALERMAEMESLTFLPEDLYDDAFAPARTAQDRACQAAGNTLLELYIAAGHLHHALGRGLDTLDRAPYSEEAAWAVAMAQALSGDRLGALRTLINFRARMEDELGTTPMGSLLELEQNLRTGRPLQSSSSRSATPLRPQRPGG